MGPAPEPASLAAVPDADATGHRAGRPLKTRGRTQRPRRARWNTVRHFRRPDRQRKREQNRHLELE
jgi:hypothetical protein